MFSMSISEMMIIFFVALIFVGPEKLPSMAKDVGKFFKTLNSTINDLKSEINKEDEEIPLIENKKDDDTKK